MQAEEGIGGDGGIPWLVELSAAEQYGAADGPWQRGYHFVVYETIVGHIGIVPLVGVDERVELATRTVERGGDIGIDEYLVEIVPPQRDGLHRVALLALWHPHPDGDAHKLIVQGGVDIEPHQIGAGEIVARILQQRGYARLLLGHLLLVVVAALLQQRFAFPFLQQRINVGLTAAKGDLVHPAAVGGRDVIPCHHRVGAVAHGVDRDGGVEAPFGLEQGGNLRRRALCGQGVVHHGGFTLIAPEVAPPARVVGVGGAVKPHAQRHEKETLVWGLVIELTDIRQRFRHFGCHLAAVGHHHVHLVAVQDLLSGLEILVHTARPHGQCQGQET